MKENSGGFIFRSKKKDTPLGVSEETIQELMKQTGLNKTELFHVALRKLADDHLV